MANPYPLYDSVAVWRLPTIFPLSALLAQEHLKEQGKIILSK